MSTFKKILKSLPGQRQGTGIDISDLVGPELFDKDKGDNLVVGTLLDTATEKIKPEAFVAGQKEIVEIEGSNDKATIAKFVESMPIADSKYIRNFMNQNEPRLDMTKTIMAPSGEKLTVNVGFGVEFFRPFF
jgi:hypothetical protein